MSESTTLSDDDHDHDHEHGDDTDIIFSKYIKRCFIIDQQIARHYVHYNECLYHPFPSM